MRCSLILAALAAAIVAGCETVPALPPELPPEPCPPSAAAAVEPAIVFPVLTSAQRLALDVAGVRVLGDVYSALALAQAQDAARSDRLEGRVNETRVWCEARQ